MPLGLHMTDFKLLSPFSWSSWEAKRDNAHLYYKFLLWSVSCKLHLKFELTESCLGLFFFFVMTCTLVCIYSEAETSKEFLDIQLLIILRVAVCCFLELFVLHFDFKELVWKEVICLSWNLTLYHLVSSGWYWRNFSFVIVTYNFYEFNNNNFRPV